MVKMLRARLKPSMKLKMQLIEEIKKPENKKVFEFIRSVELFPLLPTTKNLIDLFNQLKNTRKLFISQPQLLKYSRLYSIAKIKAVVKLTVFEAQ